MKKTRFLSLALTGTLCVSLLAGCTPDMSNEELCDALIATVPTITLTGLTGDGAGITWDASGEVSKSPKGMVIENGAYVGMD